MRKLLFALIFIISTNLFAQVLFEKEIISLRGFESETGVTHLIYGTKGGAINSSKPTQFDYYHFNTANRSDSVIFKGFINQPPNYPTEVGELIGEFGFFDKDPNKFIYIKNIYDSDVHGIIVKHDNPISFSSFYPLQHLWIDKNDQNNCYAVTENFLIKSTNRGNDWCGNNSTPTYGINLPFKFVSGNPYNGAIIYGLDNYKHLCRSIDSGKTYNIVLDNNNWGINTKLYYDINKKTVYATNGYNLYVSHNFGTDGSWEWKRTFPKSVTIELDEGMSGKLCIASGGDLYISNNYGESFTLLKSYERTIKGIYKKPGRTVIFIAFNNKIIAIDENGNNYPYYTLILNMNKCLSMYPLKVGNTWVYKTQGVSYEPYPFLWNYYTYYNKVTVTKEEYINNKKCYILSDGTYRRIDTLEGTVYSGNTLNKFETSIINLYSTLEDSLFFDWDRGWIFGIKEKDTTCFNKQLVKRSYRFNSLFIMYEEYLQNFGLIYQRRSYDFGEDSVVVIGCVIDGVVYGDTTVVSVDEPINITKFELSQNYPNPFNPSTIINYSIPESGFVNLIVYDILGRKITELVNDYKTIGNYSVLFEPQKYGLASGVYCYQIKSGKFNAVKKMIYAK